jgi:hypothetical protein
MERAVLRGRRRTPLVERGRRLFVEAGRTPFVKEGRRTSFEGGRTPFVEGGRISFVERGGRCLSEREETVHRGRTPFVDLRVGRCGGKK